MRKLPPFEQAPGETEGSQGRMRISSPLWRCQTRASSALATAAAKSRHRKGWAEGYSRLHRPRRTRRRPPRRQTGPLTHTAFSPAFPAESRGPRVKRATGPDSCTRGTCGFRSWQLGPLSLAQTYRRACPPRATSGNSHHALPGQFALAGHQDQQNHAEEKQCTHGTSFVSASCISEAKCGTDQAGAACVVRAAARSFFPRESG